MAVTYKKLFHLLIDKGMTNGTRSLSGKLLDHMAKDN